MLFLASMLMNALLMSVLILLFLLLRIPLQRHVKPGTCYAIGIIMATGLLIPLRPALPVPLARPPAPIQRLAATSTDLPETLPYDYDFTTEAHQQQLEKAQLSGEPAPLVNPASASVRAALWQIAAALWLAGLALMLVRYGVRHLRFRRLVRRWHRAPGPLLQEAYAAACMALGVQRPPRLWQCEAIGSPMLVGLFRPVILLPGQPFTLHELAAIFRHELVHFKRHDLWYKTLVIAAVCLHWWNPLVHRMARAVSSDCEMSCDDAVLAGANLAQRKLYGETILSAITRRATPHAILSTYFYEGRTDMKRRFASMLNTQPKRAGGLAIVLCLCLTVCTGSVFAIEGAPPSGSNAQGVSPTTGMPYPTGRDDAYRPVLIEISNSAEARPQLALSQADIVYEYIFWGPAHTRYLALYNDYHPEVAGAIRSTRVSSQSLRTGWDCPIIFIGEPAGDATTGADQATASPDIPQAMLFDGVHTTEYTQGIFSYLTAREVPHNAVADLQLLIREHWPVDADNAPHEPALPSLRFSDMPSQGGTPAAEVIIPYDRQDYLARYTYNAIDGHYERWYNGVPQLDGLTGQRITADNVIVLYAALAYNQGSMARPLWTLTGEGTLDVFIRGERIAGTWQRTDDASTFAYFQEDGSPLLLAPGKTFVQIVPLKMRIHYN